MSDKIEVCGKMCVLGNVYFATSNGGRKIYGQLHTMDTIQHYKDGAIAFTSEAVKSIEGINGEVLEDAPFNPVKGQWCIFGDSTVRKFMWMNGKSYLDEFSNKWNICKPVSPELAAMLEKELSQ